MSREHAQGIDIGPTILTPGPMPRAALVLLVVTASLMLFSALVAIDRPTDLEYWYYDAFYVVSAVTYPIMGMMILRRLPANRVGWLLLVIGFAAAAALAATVGADLTPALRWPAEWLPMIPIGLLPLPLLVFPDGPLLWRWWRPTWWIGVTSVLAPTTLFAIGLWLEPVPMTDWSQPDVVFDPAAEPFILAGFAAFVVLSTATVLGVAATLRVRRRNADAHLRGQLRLLWWGLAVVPPALLAESTNWGAGALIVAAVSVPLAMTVAVIAHGLYDIDLFINRSLVYAALTIVVFAAYTVTVTVAAAVFEGTRFARFVGTGVMAAAFKPARDRIQLAVNRLLYGRRDEPFAVLTHLGHQLQAVLDPDSVLPGLAQTVMSALRVPYVEVRVRRRGRMVPEVRTGRLSGDPVVFPMWQGGEVVGELVVASRQVGRDFTADEEALLTGLAERAAPAVSAVASMHDHADAVAAVDAPDRPP